jgi:predicted Rossmann fold nucleotide-binding protein DprA/Smf involved in DNA uptake
VVLLGRKEEDMQPHIQLLTAKNGEYLSYLRDKKHRDLFPKIWALGDVSILQRPLLGFFCSVKCPGDLILRTYDLARSLRDAGVAVIGGFHSPIEKDCLDLVLRGSQPIVICPARSIEEMRLGESLKEGVEKGRVLILSPFEERDKRPTAETSQRRNQFVGALAAAVFVAYADPGGKTEEFCRSVLRSGKPLYAFESQYNKAIVDAGSRPINMKDLAQWAASFNQKGQGE